MDRKDNRFYREADNATSMDGVASSHRSARTPDDPAQDAVAPQPSSQIIEAIHAYKIPDGAFDEPSPLDDIRKQYQEMVLAKLVEGVPVTLTCGGRKICTFHPNGTTEHHDF